MSQEKSKRNLLKRVEELKDKVPGELEERYERDVMEQLAKLQLLAKGDKGKRAQLKKAKILESNLLYEEDEEEDEDVEQSEMDAEEEEVS